MIACFLLQQSAGTQLRPELQKSDLIRELGKKQAFFDTVAKLNSQQQVEAVSAQLLLVNPDFDGKLETNIAGKRVVSLWLRSEKLTDIWPIGALPDLTTLWFPASGENKARVSDLSPL